MGRIRGWKKFRDERTMQSWDSKNYSVHVTSPLLMKESFVEVYESSRKREGYVIRHAPFSSKAKAMKFAIGWMKQHLQRKK